MHHVSTRESSGSASGMAKAGMANNIIFNAVAVFHLNDPTNSSSLNESSLDGEIA